MAGTKIRGITIELSADASGVNSALKSANKSISSTSKELKDIDKLLKLDPTNVTLLAQKHEALQRQITNTKSKLDALKDAEEDLKKQMVDGGTEEQQRQLAALQREIISTEKNLDKYADQMNQAERETDQLAQSQREATGTSQELSGGFSVLKGALSNLVADGIRAASDALKDLMTEGPAYADDILTMASTTSLATDTLQELSYMSGLVDVDVNTVAGSMKKLTKNMSSAKGGTGTAAEAFARLGVSVTDMNGNLRDNEDVFYDTIEALGNMENETERDAVAMDIFGKSATDLNPMIEAGGDQLKAFAQEAHDMGYVLDDEALGALGKVQDSFDRFDQKMVAVKNTVAAGLAPAIEQGMKRIQDVLNRINWKQVGDKMGKAFEKLIQAFEWLMEHGDAVKIALSGVMTVMAVSKITKIVDAVKKLGGALKSAASAAAANPYLALAAAAVACFVAIAKWNQVLYENAKANDAGWQATERMKSKLQESTEAMKQSIEAGNQMNQTMESSISAGTAQISQVQSLAGELRTLADENGVVAEKDQARAQFILNELNGALGTEYTMTGNVIDQYSNLTGSLDQVISKKQAMLILEAEEAAYQEALVNQQQAEMDLANAELARMDTQARLADVQARMNEILSMTGPELAAHAGELGGLKQQEMELTGELENQQATYEALQDTVDTYAWNIQQYTNNATAAIAEDYDAISHKSFEVAKATGEASNEASQGVITKAQEGKNGWLENLSQMVSEATGKKVEFKAAGEGMVSATVDGVEQKKQLPINAVKGMVRQMSATANQLSPEMAKSGQNAAQGLFNGTNAFSYLARQAGSNLISEFLAGAKERAEEGSPWKTTKESAHWAVLGFTNEIKREESRVKKAGIQLADGFNSAFNSTLDSGINPILTAPTVSGSSGSQSQSASGVNNVSYTQNIYSPKAPSRIDIYRQTKNLLALQGGH